MSETPYVVAAFVVAWVVLGGYAAFLALRDRSPAGIAAARGAADGEGDPR